MKRTLGVCYYPEHWPEAQWAEDARRMAELGLTWVRIGEFAWKRMEPIEGSYDWGWLDRAIQTLGEAGLKVVLGTPTATPPRWVVDKYPDMLAVDKEGRIRDFGSRRHYCFSHAGFIEECKRIVAAMAERYGQNPYVGAWQTDNEYGCHDTVLSYSPSAKQAFQSWLQQRYGQIDTLNKAWGNVFWAMEYDRFDQIGLPNLAVTEVNPAHALDFKRFSSDQVLAFNRAQVDILRQHTDAPLTHNYMGRITDFDHFGMGDDLDIATWDSYPLGFLEDRVGADDAHQRDYARQGDPDFQAFHHDLYRAVGRGRWWVMEQQPGPVNWAPHNPMPLPGMVRLWTWEAFAHGAETVNFFRWRQAPFAQEQLHSGLLRPDSKEAHAFAEVAEVARELADAGDLEQTAAPVCLVFDYEAEWAWQVQPHGQGLSYFGLVFEWYKALRQLGLTIDIRPKTCSDYSGYQLVCVPGVMHLTEEVKASLAAASCHVLIGPRAGARDESFNIPLPLPPALPGCDLAVSRVESLRQDCPIPLSGGGCVVGYREEIEGSGEVVLETDSHMPVAIKVDQHTTYVGAQLDPLGLKRLFQETLSETDLVLRDLPKGLRLRETAAERFWFNHSSDKLDYAGISIPAAGVLREWKAATPD